MIVRRLVYVTLARGRRAIVTDGYSWAFFSFPTLIVTVRAVNRVEFRSFTIQQSEAGYEHRGERDEIDRDGMMQILQYGGVSQNMWGRVTP